MERKIKFEVNAVRFRDIYGNIYHSVRVTRLKDGAVICSDNMVYGYGDSYKYTAWKLMFKAGWLPKKYTEETMYLYDRENKYPIIYNVYDGRKKDMYANVAGW